MITLETLKAQLKAGRIDRRRFMEGALTLGATVAGAEAMMGRALAAPSSGGTYKQALTGGATSDSMDPAKILDSYMINVSSQLRNNLTEIGPDNQLRAELAESWEASADAATWTFKLRKGVEFTNGKSFAAEDVVASFQHHMGEGTESAAKGLVEQIAEVRADGAETVVFTLTGGNADWPFLVSDYHLPICPAKGDGSIDWESGTGTGGYKVVSFEPGVNTVVERNPNYWKENAAYFDSIENLFIADSTARTSALISGKIHSQSNLDLKTIDLMEKSPNLVVLPTYGNKHCTFPMDSTAAPFDNNHVRLALKLAMDRAQMVKTILRGYGEAGNDHPIGPANTYRATPEELEPRDFDPDKAKFHLKQAGLDKLSVELYVASTAFEGCVEAGSLYQETARKAGIEINLNRAPDDGYWSNVWLKKPFCASYWGGRPTEDWIFSQIYAKGVDWNEGKWDHDRFNALLVEARAELDTGKRREIYVEMQRILRDEGASIIPLFMAYTHAVATDIHLPEQVASNWELDGHKNGERWAFKA
ncbi:ABC transporter substrate-binding protein [Paralimibaculum aggregatum]|uniref:ABC transporter substrate-binding protein n=1 Tax=Paralimibaculum aggregatum TaxID=3036245 RepID=A0ABQ6LIW8_9RHOB|nr:ABC transporter substrate-binding protein [Limibaculum sp. NKW23]GMG81133.1 ABC transporter substrate-binding protein [Limibaculum sp. NKW23]